MRKTLAALVFAFAPTVSFAGDYGFITAVHPIYKDQYVTRYETHCYDVEVPVYGRVRSGSSSDALVGAIIGGAVGHELGSGSNKDSLAVLGALIGASEASRSKKHEIVGYRLEQKCERVTNYVNEPMLSHYNIRYEYKGQEYHERTNRKYTLGQKVRVQTSIK